MTAPQVRAAAELRLLNVVDPALARLARIVKKGSDAVALRACQDILDRAGIGEREELRGPGFSDRYEGESAAVVMARRAYSRGLRPLRAR